MYTGPLVYVLVLFFLGGGGWGGNSVLLPLKISVKVMNIIRQNAFDFSTLLVKLLVIFKK